MDKCLETESGTCWMLVAHTGSSDILYVIALQFFSNLTPESWLYATGVTAKINRQSCMCAKS